MDVKLPSQMDVVDLVGLDGMGLDISRWDEVKSTVHCTVLMIGFGFGL